EPPQPTHNYDAKDGPIYSYIAAISEDDRKAGKAAGDVVSFVYLGTEGERHVLASMGSGGAIVRRAYCSNPCRVITYEDGRQIEYTERSIIGGAFADAIAGRLEVLSLKPLPSAPAAPVLTAPSSEAPISDAEAEPDAYSGS